MYTEEDIDRALLEAEQTVRGVMSPQMGMATPAAPAEQLQGLVSLEVQRALARVLPSIQTLPGMPGRDGITAEQVEAVVADAVSKLPKPRDGRNGRDGIDGKDGKAIKVHSRTISMPDYERLLRSDGSAQVSYTASGSAPTYGFSTRTVQGRIGDTAISVKDVLCSDGTAVQGNGTHDDTTGIQAAIDWCGTNGKGLYFPPGTYLTGQLNMPIYPNDVAMFSDGREFVTLLSSTTNTPIIKGAASVVPGHATARHLIYGFNFKAHASGSTGAALDLRIFSFSKVQNIGFEINGSGQWTYGCLLDATSHCYSNEIDDVAIKNFSPISSAVVRMASTANLHFLTHFRITASTLTNVISIANGGAAHVVIRDCHFEGLTVTNVIDPGNSNKNIIVQNCYFEDVVDSFNRSATSDVSIIDCYFAATPGASLAGALPINFASLGNNITGGTNARNRIRGRIIINGANSEDGAVQIFNSANDSGVLVSHDGTDLQINFPVDTSESYKVDNTKVVGNQGAAVADASGGATVDTEARAAINALLARLRTHGLIAT